ncbi:phosphatidylcholine:ceramide cholinephosphotransferase 2 [Ditylenchus destructor]|uniref:Phosphatidylcholine:ceramide cholinephosphotransferase 2 n=1 Tax=Ditylenchus destructor TaxID=166010 RepID=A0AAD4N490_9BILA|nr:phosphatidylcholine:ceramide cholinephosphotransferase 2 [Ditylenchus destructor]
MAGHKRDQSDSRMPLRHSEEVHASFDAQELEVRIDPRIESPTEERICVNGDASQSFQGIRNCNASQNITNRRGLEAVKTTVAFLCLLLSAFLNFFLLTVVHDIVPRKPLDDLVFFLIDQQRWAWSVGDVLSTVNAVVGFAVVLLHRDRLIVLRRVFLLAAILYGLRAVILGVTYLPPSFANRDDICLPQVNRTAMYATEIATRFVTYVVTLGLTSGQEQILCGDLMFSGHTVVLSIMYFTQLQYTPRGLVILRYIAMPITYLGIAALVVSGGHYTMDVLIAYWLTSHVFWSYHQIFEMPRHLRINAPLSRVWWFWLGYWFEADVPEGPLINEWNWPWSSPKFMHRLFDCLNAKLS